MIKVVLLIICVLEGVLGACFSHTVEGTENLYAAQWHPAFYDTANGDTPALVTNGGPVNFQGYSSVTVNSEAGPVLYYCNQTTAYSCDQGELQEIGTISYDDFSDTTGLTTLGSASVVSNTMRLTSTAVAQVGGVYITNLVSIKHFSATFQYKFTSRGTAGVTVPGADGIALVIQRHGLQLGGSGQQAGYGGIPQSLAVHVDNYENHNDPSDSFITVQTNGTGTNAAGTDYSLGWTNVDTSGEDEHTVGVTYNAYSNNLKVFFDEVQVLSITVDLESTIGVTDGLAWVGLTSATGTSYQNNDVLSFSYTTYEEELLCPCNPSVSNSAICSCIIADASSSETTYYRGNLYQSLIGIWSSSSSQITRIESGLAFQLFDAEGTSNTVEVPYNDGNPVYLFLALNDDDFTVNSGSLDVTVCAAEAVPEEDQSLLNEAADNEVNLVLLVSQSFVAGANKRQSDSIIFLDSASVEFTGSGSDNVTMNVYEGDQNSTALVGSTSATVSGVTPSTTGTTGPATATTTTTFTFGTPVPVTSGSTYTFKLYSSTTSSTSSTSGKRNSPSDLKVSTVTGNKYPHGKAYVSNQAVDNEDVKFGTKIIRRKKQTGPQGIPCDGSHVCLEQGAVVDFNFGKCLSGICVCSANSFFAGQATTTSPCRCSPPNRVEYYNNIAYCIRPHECLNQQQWMCNGVSNDYNFVQCTSPNANIIDVCKCKPGFQGLATPNNKCRCEGTIVWPNGSPQCIL